MSAFALAFVTIGAGMVIGIVIGEALYSLAVARKTRHEPAYTPEDWDDLFKDG